MYNFLALNTASSIILVLIFIFISFFCLFLFVENYKLKEKIKVIELENKRLLETKITKQKNIDSVSISKISSNNNEKKHPNNQTKKIELVQKNIPKEVAKKVAKDEHKYEEKKLYQKNVLHDKPNITSSVSLTKAEDDFNLNEFIKTNELKVEKNIDHEQTADQIINSISKNDIKISNNKKGTNIDYLKEISDKMADELKPQTIELTEYEKKQEENAIISYKELINLKDRIMMLDDDDETINFIEELKNLRNSLK